MMLERFLDGQTARSTEAGLIVASLYDAMMSAYSSLAKVERISELFSSVLVDRFSGELRDLLREFGSIALQLAKVNWASSDEIRALREGSALDFHRELFRRIQERANLLRDRIVEELTISMGVLAAAIERSEGNDLILRFIAARVREIPLKAEHLSPNYLEIVMGVLQDYISSPQEVDIIAVARMVGEIRRGMAELERNGIGADELEGLSRLLDYAKLHASNFKFLIPGMLRYLREIREEITSRSKPGDGEEGDGGRANERRD